VENTSAEMSPVARQTNAVKVGGRKPEEKPGKAGITLGAPTRRGNHRWPAFHHEW